MDKGLGGGLDWLTLRDLKRVRAPNVTDRGVLLQPEGGH